MDGMIRDLFRSQLSEEEDLHRNPLRCSLNCVEYPRARVLWIMQCLSIVSVRI